jgi:hypothetical protein
MNSGVRIAAGAMVSFAVAAVVTIIERRLASVAHPPPEALEPAAM